MSDSVQPHPWDSPGKNTAVGCHFLLQCIKVKSESEVKLLSHVWLFATPWTAAYQAHLSMGFSRQEYWSGVPLPSPTFPTTCCLSTTTQTQIHCVIISIQFFFSFIFISWRLITLQYCSRFCHTLIPFNFKYFLIGLLISSLFYGLFGSVIEFPNIWEFYR